MHPGNAHEKRGVDKPSHSDSFLIRRTQADAHQTRVDKPSHSDGFLIQCIRATRTKNAASTNRRIATVSSSDAPRQTLIKRASTNRRIATVSSSDAPRQTLIKRASTNRRI